MTSSTKTYPQLSIGATLSRLRNILIDRYAMMSYSQEGEDMVLRRILDGQVKGFYVDVGAHHPRRFSNTHMFYQQGWSGINIEPNPEAIKKFNIHRRRDTNLRIGVSDRSTILKYYFFNEPALNTFDENLALSRLVDKRYKIIKTEEVPVARLDDILRKYLPPNQQIDFLSIDVEGLDLAVLHSNDWNLFRPRCVLAEALHMTLEEAIGSDIVQFMRNNKYILFAKTFNTLIFLESQT